MTTLVASILVATVLLTTTIIAMRRRTPEITDEELDQLLDQLDHAQQFGTTHERAAWYANLFKILNPRQGNPYERDGWHKSSSSGYLPTHVCVEVKFGDDNVDVRDSKNASGPQLSFSRQNWKEFLKHIDETELSP